MARSIDQIQTAVIADVNTNIPALVSTSKFSIWRLWTRVFAISINTLENIIDVFKTNTEATAAKAGAAGSAWLQAKCFVFQYDPITPQILQFDTTGLFYFYPSVDATKYIISRASVTPDINNNVNIKVATNNPPQALTASQISGLQGYINTLGGAGITYNCISANPDQIYVNANIFYNGQYSAIIQANVIAELNIYLSNIPFNGILKVSDIEIAIRNVIGVNDVILNSIFARNDATAFASATALVLNAQTISRIWPTQAGYAIFETTTGKDLASTLVFVAQ
jgi:hypothetical protein